MNSKTLQYNNTVNSELKAPINSQPSLIFTIIRNMTRFISRSEVERIQAKHKLKQKQADQVELHQDIVKPVAIELLEPGPLVLGRRDEYQPHISTVTGTRPESSDGCFDCLVG